MLFEFKLGHSSRDATVIINKASSGGTTSKTYVAVWFKRFAAWDMSLEGASRAGRNSKFDDDVLKAIVEEGLCQTEEMMTQKLDVTQQH